MQGVSRKVFQAFLYEAVAAFCIAPAIALIYQEGLSYSGALSALISTVAVTWNMIFNALFEHWETRQRVRTRTLVRRIFHATGFEGGLTLMLLPLVSYWLNISWREALMVNISLFVFFFFYSFVFQWGFDHVFGVPDSAKETA